MDQGTGAISNRQSILAQLEYLIDELGQQQPLFRMIPPALLEGRPFEGASSIFDHYTEMTKREREALASMVGFRIDDRTE